MFFRYYYTKSDLRNKQTNKKIQNTILENPSNVKVREGYMNDLKNNKFCDTLPVDIFVDKEYVKLMWGKYISLVSCKRPPQEHMFFCVCF